MGMHFRPCFGGIERSLHDTAARLEKSATQAGGRT